jgi:hypothetical protein
MSIQSLSPIALRPNGSTENTSLVTDRPPPPAVQEINRRRRLPFNNAISQKYLITKSEVTPPASAGQLRVKRGVLNGLSKDDPWWRRLIIGGPLEFVPGLRDINPAGSFLIANARAPGVDAHPQPVKFPILRPQQIVDGVTAPKGTPGTTYFDGKGIFASHVLDDVFRVGSGYMTSAQISGLEKVRLAIKQAYSQSPSFKKMVSLRHQLLNDANGPKAPRITVLITRDSAQQKQFLGKNIPAFTDIPTGIMVFDGESLNNLHHHKDFFQVGRFKADLKPPSEKMLIIHEALHALCYTIDRERNSQTADLKFAQAEGKIKEAVVPVDHSPDSYIVISTVPTENNFARINPSLIDGMPRGKDIYFNKLTFIGENDALVNTVMREINKYHSPKLTYGDLNAFHGDPNHNIKLSLYEYKLLFEYLLKKDMQDGDLDYPYAPFDANRQQQINIDVENIRQKITFPPDYLRDDE